MDLAVRKRRTVVFEALERYCETRAVPHPSAAYWQGFVRAKREEDAHVAAWKAEKAERQARLHRQQEEAAEHARRQLERELEDARDMLQAPVDDQKEVNSHTGNTHTINNLTKNVDSSIDLLYVVTERMPDRD